MSLQNFLKILSFFIIVSGSNVNFRQETLFYKLEIIMVPIRQIQSYKKNSVSLFRNYGLIPALKYKFGNYIFISIVSLKTSYPCGSKN